MYYIVRVACHTKLLSMWQDVRFRMVYWWQYLWIRDTKSQNIVPDFICSSWAAESPPFIILRDTSTPVFTISINHIFSSPDGVCPVWLYWFNTRHCLFFVCGKNSSNFRNVNWGFSCSDREVSPYVECARIIHEISTHVV